MHKNRLFTGQPLFTQLLQLIPRQIIDQLSRKHHTNRYCKSFMAYDHLVSMLYAGFFKCTSLREVVTGLEANGQRLSHLGLRSIPRRSTLSDANKRRGAKFFGDLYHRLYSYHFGLPDSRSKNQEDRLFIIDSTTITLFSAIMKNSMSDSCNGRAKGGAKAHIMLDSKHDIPQFVTITESKENDKLFLQTLIVPENSTVVVDKAYVSYKHFKAWGLRNIRWVTRLKKNASIKVLAKQALDDKAVDMGVLSDKIVLLGRYKYRKQTPIIKARIVEYYDKETNREFSFITNDLSSDPFTITQLYKQRWQIEIFFKRIKQRYPLRYFLGDNVNAIQIQIWTALICDLLVQIVKRKVNALYRKRWAYATLSAMIKHHLMTYINLFEFLRNPEKSIKNNRQLSSQLQLFGLTGAVF